MENKDVSLQIPNLAFDVGVFKQRDKRLPAAARFILKYDADEHLITEELDQHTRDILKIYYELGGYGSTPLGEGDFGTRQGIEVFEAIQTCLKACGKDIQKMSFVEIGCSYGYLLHLLDKAGAQKVLGIEPGEEGVIGSRKYNIPLIQDFFPTDRLEGKVDCILTHAVLEHVEKPGAFVREIHNKLNDGGVTFIAVPDSEKKMLVGDASILSHQHINYFTQHSLTDLMRKEGFIEVSVAPSRQRAILYGWGVKSTPTSGAFAQDGDRDRDTFQRFRTSLEKNVRSIQSLVETYENEQRTIGFYAPSGALGGMIHFRRDPRIFNSDEVKHGKHLNGFDAAIESPEKLAIQPVDVLFVESIDYDREIRDSLSRKGIDRKTLIVSLKELYETNSEVKYDVGF